MAYLTDGQLLSDLADALKKDVGDLRPYWPNILSQSHGWAAAWIINRLLARGFTLAQIVLWDMGPFYERDLTLWHALNRGGGLEGYDDKFIKALDVREELTKLLVLEIGGIPQAPEGIVGTVHTGSYDTTSDTFVFPGTRTEHLGEDARF